MFFFTNIFLILFDYKANDKYKTLDIWDLINGWLKDDNKSSIFITWQEFDPNISLLQ